MGLPAEGFRKVLFFLNTSIPAPQLRKTDQFRGMSLGSRRIGRWPGGCIPLPMATNQPPKLAHFPIGDTEPTSLLSWVSSLCAGQDMPERARVLVVIWLVYWPVVGRYFKFGVSVAPMRAHFP